MATHSSILAWIIPWTEDPGGVQSMDCKGLDVTEAVEHACTHLSLPVSINVASINLKFNSCPRHSNCPQLLINPPQLGMFFLLSELFQIPFLRFHGMPLQIPGSRGFLLISYPKCPGHINDLGSTMKHTVTNTGVTKQMKKTTIYKKVLETKPLHRKIRKLSLQQTINEHQKTFRNNPHTHPCQEIYCLSGCQSGDGLEVEGESDTSYLR